MDGKFSHDMQSIAKSSSKYTGIEYSSVNMTYINEIRSNYKIIQGDAHNIPFHESEFQIINALAMINVTETYLPKCK